MSFKHFGLLPTAFCPVIIKEALRLARLQDISFNGQGAPLSSELVIDRQIGALV